MRKISKKGSFIYKKTLEDMRLSIKPSDFFAITRSYLNSILKHYNKTVFLNQPFPANAPLLSMKMFGNDTKAIIVERDPRDLYVLLKKIVKPNWFPYEDVDSFIAYYKQNNTSN